MHYLKSYAETELISRIGWDLDEFARSKSLPEREDGETDQDYRTRLISLWKEFQIWLSLCRKREAPEFRYEEIKTVEDFHRLSTLFRENNPINGWLLIKLQYESHMGVSAGTATFQKVAEVEG